MLSFLAWNRKNVNLALIFKECGTWVATCKIYNGNIAMLDKQLRRQYKMVDTCGENEYATSTLCDRERERERERACTAVKIQA